jgi:prolyl-tRNA editing enzyme YbaK/EbsC (Cys-tRNA(Pro) deacylase)
MTGNLPEASRRVAAAAEALGLALDIKLHEVPTRTAEEAAAACACDVAQIVKSLVFRGKTSGKPYLLLVSGANRVNERGVAAHLGEKLERPDAAFVREATGYAIGGIPPLGHTAPLATYLDENLLAFPTVWAAAGTPNTVFEIAPAALAQAVGARQISVR